MGVKGGVIGSIAKLKSAVKRGSGAGFIKNVQTDQDMTVRFLTEPDQWFSYFEHYDAERKFYPCADDCPGCAEGNKPSQRFLANVLDIEDNMTVIALKLPTTLADSLMRRYEKYSTMLDRDYELSRSGSGFNDTKYEAIPLGPKTRNLNRYELLDLGAILDNLAPGAEDDSADDDDEPPARSKAKADIRKRLQRIKEQQEEDEDDDDAPRRRSAPIKRRGQARAEKEAEDQAAFDRRTARNAKTTTTRRPVRGTRVARKPR